jgi:hypothetical protein
MKKKRKVKGTHEGFHEGDSIYINANGFNKLGKWRFSDREGVITRISYSCREACPCCGNEPIYAMVTNDTNNSGVWLCLLSKDKRK